MKKQISIILICWIFVISNVFALSDPINQTLTEYTNLTRADNFLEVAQELNVWLGGLLGISLLIMIFVIMFGVSMFFTQQIARSLVFSSFMLVMSSIFLRTAALIPDSALYFSVPLFLISLGFAIITK